MARISVQGIVKNYGKLPILKGIDLEIADGEFLTLVGPSGCGKSTTLRVIAGLEAQDGGDIAIDGRVVNTVRASERDLAMVFQSYALYPHLSVRDNLATPLLLRNLTFAQRVPLLGLLMPGRGDKVRALRKLVLETAESLQIEHLLDRKPGQLSGGQRQRVALGRAMVRNPAAFLMDEPLSNLDAGLRIHMRAELAELHRSLGTTFVYVTHDQAEALTMSDRVAVMMDGELLQVGTPRDIYRDPCDIRVAQFIGSPKINLLPGVADAQGRVDVLGMTLTRRTAAQSAGKLRVGIRPEHLTLRTTSSGDTFPGRVAHIENLGSDVYLHVVVEELATRVIVSAKPAAAEQVDIGETVHLGREPGQALVFDDAGKRLALNAVELRERALQ